MTYITGTITDANPGPTLHTLMATALTGVGFTLVDTVVIAPRTHKVYLSAAAGNAIGKDWYLDLAYTTTGAGILFLGVCEFFDPATDLAYRAQFSANSRPSEATYYSPWGSSGFALETTWWPHAGAGAAASTNSNLDLPSSAFGYWISITRDRVIVLLSSTAQFPIYAGTYSPSAGHAAAAGADLYPLIMGKIIPSGMNSSSSGYTRLPKHVTASSIGWGLTSAVIPASGAIRPPGLPSDHVTAHPRAASLFPLSTSGGSGSATTMPPQVYLGTFRDVAAIAADSGVVRGDTVSDGTNTWVLASANGPTAALFKAI